MTLSYIEFDYCSLSLLCLSRKTVMFLIPTLNVRLTLLVLATNPVLFLCPNPSPVLYLCLSPNTLRSRPTKPVNCERHLLNPRQAMQAQRLVRTLPAILSCQKAATSSTSCLPSFCRRRLNTSQQFSMLLMPLNRHSTTLRRAHLTFSRSLVGLSETFGPTLT